MRLSRRQVVQGMGAVGVGLLAGCGRWPGQAPPAQVARVGYLATNEEPARLGAFRQGLTELGYAMGQNLVIEARFAGGHPDRLPALAAELVALPVDIILVRGTVPVRTAMAATTTIPLVTVGSEDPVAFGLTASLARPGGNVTGLSSIAQQLNGKRLELLKDAVPVISRVAVLWNPAIADRGAEFPETEAAGRALGLTIQSLEVRAAEELARAFAAAIQDRADALLTLDNFLLSAHLGQLVDFTTHHRLPWMSANRDWTEAGGLLAYGPNLTGQFHRAAYYVDRILKGAKPADLPVEQPMTFEYVINLRTAQALGLTIPPHVLLQATEVLQ
jgi:putative tryptophan/tyrosine transport system substrate-binding protein